MRFIGGKSTLLNEIGQVIDRYAPQSVGSATDLFAGSGAVSNFFKGEKGFSVVTNDRLYFSYVMSRGTTALNEVPDFSKLTCKDPIEYLNSICIDDVDVRLSECFIFNNYSPNSACERMYFQPHNALKIDIIRITIENWFNADLIDEDGYFYLLAALIAAVPYVANITGTFGAYLKFWDSRSCKQLSLKHPSLLSGRECRCLNGDFKQALQIETDLLYADPPYNSREYLPNYHVLETIARYDYPEIHGVTGIRNYEGEKSDFCKKARVLEAFETLLRDTASKYVLISYNNEGLVPTETLCELCQEYAQAGSFHLTELDYRRYKSKIPNNKAGLKEQLYFLRRQ